MMTFCLSVIVTIALSQPVIIQGPCLVANALSQQVIPGLGAWCQRG